MPRRLSNPEWVQFQNDVNLSALGLPPWGAVVQWGEQYILVYICPSSGGLCRAGEAMLTDVSDRADLIKNIPPTYDTTQGVWWYHLEPEGIDQLARVAQGTLQATGKIIQTIAEEAGKAAGGLTAPLLSNLTPLLVVLGIALLIMYGPRSD